MGKAYSMHGGNEKFLQSVWLENLKDRDHSAADTCIDGCIMLNGSLGNGFWCVAWIYLDHDRDRWQTVVNTAVKLLVL
jgi:hypothetical protein